MQNRPFRFGPLALTNAAANVLNPGTAAGGVNDGNRPLYVLLTHVRFVNKTAAQHSFSMYLGATGASAAGTEVMGTAKIVPANDYIDWYGRLRLDVADFLTGLADANTAITIQGEGEIGLA